MRLEIEETSALTFDDGTPVRAASAIAPFGDGWLVAQDDATHAAWLRPVSGVRPGPGDRPESITPVRVIDPVDGWETFSSAAGTKHLKPDFEAACPMPGGEVLLLGSGSSPARMRASLVGAGGFTVADLRPLYLAVAAALGLHEEQLNLEGACLAGGRLRWFQRANLKAGAATASADIEVSALLAAVRGEAHPDTVTIHGVRRYDLGTVRGVALAVTDAVTLADGRVLVSAAAEDTPNAIDDGPVVASGLALLGADGEPPAFAEIPGAEKVEGLALRETTADGARLLAVIDADDHEIPSRRLALRLYR
ncbi:DUF6910 family protein [Actinoplanes sp. CA-252034]|uniref:DUF6910 family protein n=1 Tax=Actinoplanes sp. CA-252034 TaxID=3239906 RepID=UPI003D96F208